MTALVLVLGPTLLGLTWRDYKNGWRMKVFGKGTILIYLSIACLFPVWNAYCLDADQPHIRVTGIVQFVKRYAIHRRHQDDIYGFLGCINDCSQKAPLLEFDPGIFGEFSPAPIGEDLTVVYLGRQESADVGPYSISAHPIVEIDDPGSGRQLFYTDTTRHWWRVTLLLADSLFCWLSLYLCNRMARTNPDLEDDRSDRARPDPKEPSINTLTGLGLGVEDKDIDS